jgi:hypothetical protein
MSNVTVRDLEAAFSRLSECCLHSPAWIPGGDADRVLCSVSLSDPYSGSRVWEDAGAHDIGSSDGRTVTVVQLIGGRFGLLSESSDYTGHGCVCSAFTGVYGTVDELLQFGVDDESAREAVRMRL